MYIYIYIYIVVPEGPAVKAAEHAKTESCPLLAHTRFPGFPRSTGAFRGRVSGVSPHFRSCDPFSCKWKLHQRLGQTLTDIIKERCCRAACRRGTPPPSRGQGPSREGSTPSRVCDFGQPFTAPPPIAQGSQTDDRPDGTGIATTFARVGRSQTGVHRESWRSV